MNLANSGTDMRDLNPKGARTMVLSAVATRFFIHKIFYKFWAKMVFVVHPLELASAICGPVYC